MSDLYHFTIHALYSIAAHLEESTVVEKAADGGNDAGARLENAAHVAIRHQVQVALPIPRLLHSMVLGILSRVCLDIFSCTAGTST